MRDIEDGLIHELQADDGYSWKWHCEQKDKEIERLKNELNTANLWCHIAEMKVDEVLPVNTRLRGLLREWVDSPCQPIAADILRRTQEALDHD